MGKLILKSVLKRKISISMFQIVYEYKLWISKQQQNSSTLSLGLAHCKDKIPIF
jgi:hypothetical protein